MPNEAPNDYEPNLSHKPQLQFPVMNFIAKKIHWIGILLLAGFATLAAGLYFDGPARTPRQKAAAPAAEKYVCPMHPEVARVEPGACPQCGMALVPASQARTAAAGCGAGEDHNCCGDEGAARFNLPPGHPPIPPGLMPPGCTMTPALNSTNSGSL